MTLWDFIDKHAIWGLVYLVFIWVGCILVAALLARRCDPPVEEIVDDDDNLLN